MKLTELVQACERDLKVLRSSATFAMSRGGKELFHTNFIAFVLDLIPEELDSQDAEVVSEVRVALLKELFGERHPEKVWTWRERQSLDLVVVAAPGSKQDVAVPHLGRSPLQPFAKKANRKYKLDSVGCFAVVIEAKVKALPTAAQLKRYTDKLSADLWLDLPEPIDLPPTRPDEQARRWGRIKLWTDPQQGGAVKTVTQAKVSTVDATVWAYPSASTGPLDDERDAMAGQGSPDVDVSSGGGAFAGARGELRKVLLAPRDPDGVASESAWDFISLSSLVSHFPDSERTRRLSFIAQLLSDYRSSTEALLRVLDALYNAVDTDFCSLQSRTTLRRLRLEVTHDRFASLRVHDVVGKYAYSVLLRRLVAGASLEREIAADGGAFKLRPEAFLTNATPGLNLEYAWDKGEGRKRGRIGVGVQLQGERYRHFLSVSHSEVLSPGTLRELALTPGSVWDTWWAVGGSIPGRSVEPQAPEFKSFGEDAFLYREIDASRMTFQELLVLVRESMNAAAGIVADVAMQKFGHRYFASAL